MRTTTIRRLFDHMRWADDLVAGSLARRPEASPEAWGLYAHVLGAEQVWLARILGTPAGPVWPDPDPGELGRLRVAVHEGFAGLLACPGGAGLDASIAYTNSAGRDFESTVEDILLHVFLHGSYHRGQIAYLLRDAGAQPAPTDYIAFVRGAAAATRTDADPTRPG